MKEIKEFVQTRNFKILLGVVGSLIFVLIVFQLGVFVGFRKASFSYGYGDNYYRNFGYERGGMMGFVQSRGESGRDDGFFMMTGARGDLLNSHGVIGRVININLPTIIVQGGDGVEKTIRINDNTVIMKFRDKIASKDIKVDDFIAVIGAPNDKSEIESKLIRIMPSPPNFVQGTTTQVK